MNSRKTTFARLLTAFLVLGCSAPATHLDTSKDSSETPGLERVRRQQNLEYVENGDTKVLPLDFVAESDSGFAAQDAIPIELADWITEHCDTLAGSSSCSGVGCVKQACELDHLSCEVDTLLELAKAVDEVELAASPDPITIPIQSKAVRAALAEAGVRYLVYSFQPPTRTDLNDASCAGSSGGVTYRNRVTVQLRELHELALESAELAAENYVALADTLWSLEDGPRLAREVRAHGAGFIAGRHRRGSAYFTADPAVAGVDRLRCQAPRARPAVETAKRLIRESGLPPDLIGALPGSMSEISVEDFVDAGPTVQSLKRRLARVWSAEDRYDAMNGPAFLREFGLTMDDVQEARVSIAERQQPLRRPSIASTRGYSTRMGRWTRRCTRRR